MEEPEGGALFSFSFFVVHLLVLKFGILSKGKIRKQTIQGRFFFKLNLFNFLIHFMFPKKKLPPEEKFAHSTPVYYIASS